MRTATYLTICAAALLASCGGSDETTPGYRLAAEQEAACLTGSVIPADWNNRAQALAAEAPADVCDRWPAGPDACRAGLAVWSAPWSGRC